MSTTIESFFDRQKRDLSNKSNEDDKKRRRKRERERDRQTDRQRDRQTERQREKFKYIT